MSIDGSTTCGALLRRALSHRSQALWATCLRSPGTSSATVRSHRTETWRNMEKHGHDEHLCYLERVTKRGALKDDSVRLARRLADALSSGDQAEALRLTRLIEGRITNEDSSTDAGSPPEQVRRLEFTAPPSVVAVRKKPQPRGSARQATVASLSEIGVPCRARLIADYAAARFGDRIEPRAFAAMRRDERRSWTRSSARPTFVVPALEGRFYQPIRGLLTLSDWPLERRLVGPWSERADHLLATAQLARQLAWLNERDPEVAERLAPLVAGMARSIPGAMEGSEVDTARVASAAEAEHGPLAERDEAWRHDAAARGRERLTEDEQLWGVRVGVVDQEERWREV